MSHHKPFVRQEETVLIAGSFATDATTGAVTAGSSRGKGFTFSKPSGTGLYRVTFTADGTRKYPRLLSVVASVEDNAESTVTVVNSTASNGYVELQVYTAGVAADLDAGRIHFVIVAQNTGAGTV